jgi:hypothetical protein
MPRITPKPGRGICGSVSVRTAFFASVRRLRGDARCPESLNESRLRRISMPGSGAQCLRTPADRLINSSAKDLRLALTMRCDAWRKFAAILYGRNGRSWPAGVASRQKPANHSCLLPASCQSIRGTAAPSLLRREVTISRKSCRRGLEPGPQRDAAGASLPARRGASAGRGGERGGRPKGLRRQLGRLPRREEPPALRPGERSPERQRLPARSRPALRAAPGSLAPPRSSSRGHP